MTLNGEISLVGGPTRLSGEWIIYSLGSASSKAGSQNLVQGRPGGFTKSNTRQMRFSGTHYQIQKRLYFILNSQE